MALGSTSALVLLTRQATSIKLPLLLQAAQSLAVEAAVGVANDVDLKRR